MATLEERVSKLESDVQSIREAEISAGLRAHAFGLSLVRDEVDQLRSEMRDGFANVNGRIDAVAAGVAGLGERMTNLEHGIGQILDRLNRD